MHKKCSHCGLVNWPQETNCRRCGTPLGETSQAEFSPLRTQLQANDFSSSEDNDAAYDEAKAMIKKGVTAGMVYGGISLVLILLLQVFVTIPGDLVKYA